MANNGDLVWSIMDLNREARRGQEEARRGQEEARRGPEEARKGQEKTRRGPEEARRGPEEARKRPGRGQRIKNTRKKAPKGQESRIWRKTARTAMFYEQKIMSLEAPEFWRFWRV